MSGAVVGWAFGRPEKLSPTQRFVLVAIADNADGKGRAWPSKKELARKTGLGLATVYRALGELEKLGLFSESVEDGREHFLLAVSQSENASHGDNADSQTEKTPSQSENRTTTKEPSSEPSQETGLLSDPVEEAFDFWKQTMGLNGSVKLTPDRKRKAAKRLGEPEMTLDRLKRAILGYAGSEWHRKNRPDVDSFELICRKPENIERFESMPVPAAAAPPSEYDRPAN